MNPIGTEKLIRDLEVTLSTDTKTPLSTKRKKENPKLVSERYVITKKGKMFVHFPKCS